MPHQQHHFQVTHVHLALAVLVATLIVSLVVLVVPAHGAGEASDPAALEGFSTAAAIITFVFITTLLTVVATIGKLLFRHADRHGEGLRDELPAGSNTSSSDQTTMSIADAQRLATRIG